MREALIHRIYGLLGRRRRRARMRAFLESFRPAPETTILDIGGTAAFWQGLDLNVTLLNKEAPPAAADGGLPYVEGDAVRIPFADGSFDVAFSNSMIEHLHTLDNQRAAAGEANRVGRRLWIQTPNKWFPFEPHFLTPFVHWLPASWRRRLVRNFTVWGLVTRPDPEYARRVVDEIRLLSAAELRELFPACEIRRERFLGMTKSLIVVRDRPPVSGGAP